MGKQLKAGGFDNIQQQKLAEFCQKQQPVTLVNCEVRPSKWGSELELVLNKNTQITKPSAKFEMFLPVSSDSPTKQEFLDHPLNHLESTSINSRVRIKAKFVQQKEVEKVKPTLSKQDYIVAVAAGATATLTTWEENMGILTVGSSYEVCGLIVREYQG